MSELFRFSGEVRPTDSKTYQSFHFAVPQGVSELQVTFAYEQGQSSPHNLIVLALDDPNGFRGIAHRFATRQVIRLGAKSATPGFVPGVIPSGEWTIQLSMFWIVPTVEARPWTYSILVEAHKPAPASQKVSTAPARSGRWFKGDLHAHTTHSDGSWSLRELAESARTYGLDFIALTDHNTVSGLPEIAEASGDDLLIIPGIEVTTFNGHAVSLGTERRIDWRTGQNERTINTVAADVRAEGGVFVVVHPDAPRDEICTGCRWVYPDFDWNLANAVQVWGGSFWNHPDEHNPGCLKLWKDCLNRGSVLTALGGTDTHGPDGWGEASGWTYVWAEELSVDAILTGVREGRTFVSSGPRLNIGAQEQGQASTEGWTVRASWSACPEAELRVIANGETRHAQRVADRGEVQVTMREGDSWCCAELWDPRGETLLAVTSAVYLAAKADREAYTREFSSAALPATTTPAASGLKGVISTS